MSVATPATLQAPGTRSRRLRVLHIIGQAHFGGIEKLAIDIVAVQKADPGLEPALCFNFGADGGFGAAFRELGIPLHSANLTSGADASPSKCRDLVKLFRTFDVIHVHAFNPLVALATILAGIAVVFTEHGVFGFGRPKRFADLINPRLLRAYLNRYVSYVTFNSDFTAGIARHRYGLKHTPNKVIYNGIRLPDKQQSAPPVDAVTASRIAGKFVVGTSSRFAGFKRVDRLIDAFARFAPGRNAILLLVGDGQLRASLESQVARLGIGEQVHFTGFQPNVTAYQELMSVCVFASENEPFGLVAVECLSLGKPVLVLRDGGGIIEVVNGLTHDDIVDGVEGLAARLSWRYEHQIDLIEGVGNRREYARNFDIRRTVAAFSEVYKDVLGGRETPGRAGQS